ncbi:MAG: hypothetical protein WDZ81_01410 [Candidatus Saccharimonadales bacterium]
MKKLLIALLGIFLAASLVGAAGTQDTNPSPTTPTPTTVTETVEEPAETEPTEAACTSWQLAQADHGENHRWFASGVESIRTASTPEEAREAASEWLMEVRQDPELLAAASQFVLNENVDSSTLFDGDGCATSTAEVLVAEIELTLAVSSITPEEAPTNGVNSGVDSDGNATVASITGISGDRKAIQITFPDGTSIWILARCGNPVTEDPPSEVPEGPTDEKCDDPDGDGFCGTPDSGPEQQPPQTGNDEELVEPTDGYEAGNAETVVSQQEADRQAVEDGRQDQHEPTDYGQEVLDSEEGGEAPAGETDHSTTTSDTTTSGTSEGTSDPEDTPASGDNNEDEVVNPWGG